MAIESLSWQNNEIARFFNEFGLFFINELEIMMLKRYSKQ